MTKSTKIYVVSILFTGVCYLTSGDAALSDEFMFDPLQTSRISPRRLSLQLQGGDAVVTWSGEGILQQAQQINGPWNCVSITKPFRARLGVAHFYRVISANRPAKVYIPPHYQTGVPMPLIISLHGYGNDSTTQENAIPLRPLADSKGFLYCVPEGTRNSNGARYWAANDACGGGVDDVGYLIGIIRTCQQSLSVDSRKIFLVGVSNGGLLAYRVACERAAFIAAIVSVGGALWDAPVQCKPSSAVSALEIHGTADSTSPYSGGSYTGCGRFLGALETIRKWGSFQNCTSMVVSTNKTLDLDANIPGFDTMITRMTDCHSGAVAELWTVVGGGHVPKVKSGTNYSDLASKVVEWLFAHPKPQL